MTKKNKLIGIGAVLVLSVGTYVFLKNKNKPTSSLGNSSGNLSTNTGNAVIGAGSSPLDKIFNILFGKKCPTGQSKCQNSDKCFYTNVQYEKDPCI